MTDTPAHAPAGPPQEGKAPPQSPRGGGAPVDHPDYVITYAQNREDLIIDAFFPDVEKGSYVDVGANHPSIDSVTKFFYLRGWRGVNIEPSRRCYELLLAERPEDENVNLGVSDRQGRLTFREYPHSALSTFSDAVKNAHSESSSPLTDAYTEVEVEVTTLAALLSEMGVGHIHFLKVDAEGHEYQVLRGNDWTTYRPELICIEASDIEDWRSLLAEQGYTLAFFDGLNEYYLAAECMRRRDAFAYVNRVLIDRPVVPHWLHLHLEAARGRIEQLEAALQAARGRIEHLESDLRGRESIGFAAVALARALAAQLRRRAGGLAGRRPRLRA